MIKSINKETDFAIRIVMYISKKKKLVTSKEIAKDLGLSESFVRKIVRVLTNNGVLGSKNGIGGGVFLTSRTEQITLLDIVKIFQGGLKFLNCINDEGQVCSEINTCKLRKKILNLEYKMSLEFENTYVIDLV